VIRGSFKIIISHSFCAKKKQQKKNNFCKHLLFIAREKDRLAKLNYATSINALGEQEKKTDIAKMKKVLTKITEVLECK